MKKAMTSKALYILVAASAFFAYQSYLLLNSFQADYDIYARVMSTIAENGLLFRPIFWLSSELIGEIGLIVRFAGAFFFLAVAWIFFRKTELTLGKLRKGVLLEAIQYLFFIPFIVYLFTGPNSIASYGAATSYTIQILIITPIFLMLYTKLGKNKIENANNRRWLAIGITCFFFALWVKHFLFNLYALPVDLKQPVLVLGLVNSSITLLIAAIGLLVSFFPIIKGKGATFSSKGLGVSLFFVGLYFIIYIGISLVNPIYLSYLTLTELWAIAVPIIGLSILKSPKEASD